MFRLLRRNNNDKRLGILNVLRLMTGTGHNRVLLGGNGNFKIIRHYTGSLEIAGHKGNRQQQMFLAIRQRRITKASSHQVRRRPLVRGRRHVNATNPRNVRRQFSILLISRMVISVNNHTIIISYILPRQEVVRHCHCTTTTRHKRRRTKVRVTKILTLILYTINTVNLRHIHGVNSLFNRVTSILLRLISLIRTLLRRVDHVINSNGHAVSPRINTRRGANRNGSSRCHSAAP